MNQNIISLSPLSLQ